MNINDYSGAKLAILAKGHILTLLRDDDPTIPFPGMWDLPGGAREGAEKPLDCALRETWEEVFVRVSRDEIVWKRIYRNTTPGELAQWFFVAQPGWLSLPMPRLGSEGQAVKWWPVHEFLALPDGIDHLQDRLRDFLGDASASARVA